jgi:hypothetical protein
MIATGGPLVRSHAAQTEGWVDGHNRPVHDKPMSLPDAAKWVIDNLKK